MERGGAVPDGGRRPSEGGRGDGHVLSFGAAIPTGRSDHHSWTVSGPSRDIWLTALAGFHEAAHAQLNFGTAWGALLQSMSLLPTRKSILTKLVKRCFRTHEAFATHSSIMRVIGREAASDVEHILARYPAYRAHFRTALRLGPAAAIEQYWRAHVCDVALTVCMQADVITPLFDVGVEQFTLSRLRDHDTPDNRLKLLIQHGADLWESFERMARETFGHDRWAVLRSVKLRDAPDAVDSKERERLDQLCLEHLARSLGAAGRTTLDVAEVLAALPAVVDAVGRSPGYSGKPLILDNDPTSLFDLERLQLRAPLPAQVRHVDTARPENLASGASPDRHVFLTVRRAGVLRRQFALRDDPWPGVEEEPVVAMQVRGQRDELTLFRVDSPDQLETISLPESDHGLLANVALTCARDHHWARRWATPLHGPALVTILIDTPFSQSLDALLADAAQFRYALVPLMDGTQLWTLVCTVGQYPPLVLPCTLHRAQALAAHTRSKTAGEEPIKLSALVSEPEAVLTVVRRIVADESTVDHDS